MANRVFQPILNQPDSPVQQLAPVQRPDILGPLIDAGTKGVDIATTAIVRNQLIGEQTTLEGVAPSQDQAQILGGATEDALIDRELTLTQIAAARKAGMSGSKAKTLVDIKTRQAINKFPFLANKIRKQSSAFFGGGAGSGSGFFKDAKTLEEMQAESLVKGGWATPQEARDPVRLEAIGTALTQMNRNSKLKASELASINLELRQTKRQIDKANTVWTRATSDQHIQAQVLMPSQMDNISGLFERGEIVQAQAGLDDLRRRVSGQLNIGAENSTRQDFANSSLAVLERDWFGPMQEVINGTRTNTQMKNQQQGHADALLNAFWAFDNKNLALWQQAKAVPANTAWDDSAFNTAWTDFMGAISNNVPFNPVAQPKKWKRAFDELIASPKEARLGDSTDEAVLDYSGDGLNVLLEGTRNFNLEGSTKLEQEGFVGIVDSYSKVGIASLVRANPGKFNADTVQQVNTAIESEMTTLTVPIVNEELTKLGLNAANVELIARAADVRFQVKPGVMDSLPFNERVELNNAVITLNKKVTPSLNNAGRAKAHLTGSTQYASTMKEVATTWNAKRARIATQSVVKARAGIQRLRDRLGTRGIHRGGQAQKVGRQIDELEKELIKLESQPEAATPESTRSNLDAQITDITSEIQQLLTAETATFETNKRVQELTAERKVLEGELKRITPEAPATVEEQRQVQIEAAGLTEEDVTELATLESFGERREFLLSRASQQPVTEPEPIEDLPEDVAPTTVAPAVTATEQRAFIQGRLDDPNVTPEEIAALTPRFEQLTKEAATEAKAIDKQSKAEIKFAKDIDSGKDIVKTGGTLRELLRQEEGSKAVQEKKGFFRNNRFFEFADRNTDGSINGKVIGFGHELLGGESFPDGITAKKAEELLAEDIGKATADASRILNENNITLNDKQFNAFVEMVFQMGEGSTAKRTGVRGFKDMLAALAAGDLKTAKAEALNSEWNNKDTPKRAKRVVKRFFGTLEP